MRIKIYKNSTKNFLQTPEIIDVCNLDFKEGKEYKENLELDSSNRSRIEVKRMKITNIINQKVCCVRKK